ncbi:Uu.00g065030.m01.CDS01 [Anthostomella pinea]|uniref:Uu.00g065030.m01.CDS01 n=1 Tax=Anthostomella pinea TaxID=933095 RepID=A0AAI8YN46_9PEZI|nr:Uu.00g065030.m01.CDS01 [Anthostomella pinea]
MAPKILVGSGTWGHNLDIDQVQYQIANLDKLDCQEIDPVALYPFTNPGLAEKFIGEIGRDGLLVDSKVMWFDGGNKTLTIEAIATPLRESLERLKAHKVNVFYALGPDHVTPLQEQAAGFNAVFRQGKCAKTGVSNFPPDLFKEYLGICEEQGYVKPSVYQGQYNLLCRTYETTLFPLLRKHNVAFIAYSPLAGGMLTGKVTFADNPDALKGTRFEVSKDNAMGMAGRHWYDKPSFHDAIRKLAALCDAHDIDMTDASMRWLLNHSMLTRSEGTASLLDLGTNNSSRHMLQLFM